MSREERIKSLRDDIENAPEYTYNQDSRGRSIRGTYDFFIFPYLGYRKETGCSHDESINWVVDSNSKEKSPYKEIGIRLGRHVKRINYSEGF